MKTSILNLRQFNELIKRSEEFHLPYLSISRIEEMADSASIRDDEFIYLCATDNNKICGVSEIQRNPFSGRLTLNYLSVNKMNSGISKLLLAALCDHLKSIGYTDIFEVAAFSQMGKLYLMKNLNLTLSSQGVRWRSDDGNEGTPSRTQRRMAA